MAGLEVLMGTRFEQQMGYIKRMSLRVTRYKNCCWSGVAPRKE